MEKKEKESWQPLVSVWGMESHCRNCILGERGRGAFAATLEVQ